MATRLGLGLGLSRGGRVSAPEWLSSPADTETGATTATATVSTTQGDGTIFAVSSPTQPVSGIDMALNAGWQATVSATGVQTINITGLSPSTLYDPIWFVQRSAAGVYSAIVGGDGFTTDASGIVAPDAIASGDWTLSQITNTPDKLRIVFNGPLPADGGSAITAVKRDRVADGISYGPYNLKNGGGLPILGQNYDVVATPGVANDIRIWAENGFGTPNKGTAKSVTPWAAPGTAVLSDQAITAIGTTTMDATVTTTVGSGTIYAKFAPRSPNAVRAEIIAYPYGPSTATTKTLPGDEGTLPAGCTWSAATKRLTINLDTFNGTEGSPAVFSGWNVTGSVLLTGQGDYVTIEDNEIGVEIGDLDGTIAELQGWLNTENLTQPCNNVVIRRNHIHGPGAFVHNKAATAWNSRWRGAVNGAKLGDWRLATGFVFEGNIVAGMTGDGVKGQFPGDCTFSRNKITQYHDGLPDDWLDTWDSGTTYAAGDLVAHPGGGAYACISKISGNIGNTPPASNPNTDQQDSNWYVFTKAHTDLFNPTGHSGDFVVDYNWFQYVAEPPPAQYRLRVLNNAIRNESGTTGRGVGRFTLRNNLLERDYDQAAQPLIYSPYTTAQDGQDIYNNWISPGANGKTFYNVSGYTNLVWGSNYNLSTDALYGLPQTYAVPYAGVDDWSLYTALDGAAIEADPDATTAVSATGAQAIAVTGLTAAAQYPEMQVVHKTTAGYSNIVAIPSFQTVGTSTLTATVDPFTAVAALQDYAVFPSGAHLGIDAADIPVAGTVPGAPDGTTVEARAVYYDDATGIATGVTSAWSSVGVTSGEAYSGTFSVPTMVDTLAKREVRVAGSSAAATLDTWWFAAGHRVAVYEQSNIAKVFEPKNWSTSTSLDPSAVVDPEAFQLFAVDRQTGVVTRTRITSNASEATSVSASVVAIANILAANRPGEKFAFAAHTQSNTSPTEMIRDRATAGARPARAWDDELALHQAFTAVGGPVDLVVNGGWVSYNTSGTNDNEWLPIGVGKLADGTALSVGDPVDWAAAAGVEYTLTHCLTEFYDYWNGTTGWTKHMFVGPHGKSPASSDDLTVDFNPSNLDMQYESIRDEYTARANSGLFPELYPAVWEDQGCLRRYNDQLHHDATVYEGQPKLGEMLAIGILKTAGLVTWETPEFTNAYWASDGSYVDVWMDGQDITTARNEAGGTSAYIRGFTVDANKVTTPQLQSNAGGSGYVGVRITPPAGYVGPGTGASGVFDYATQVSYGRGHLMGYRLWGGGATGDLNPSDPYTRDLPGLAGHVPGMDVVPIQPRSMENYPDDTGNTLTAPASFSTSGTQRFVSPTNISAVTATPDKLRFYMKGQISNVGADQRLCAIGGWATITARTGTAIRVTGMSSGNHDKTSAFTFGAIFELMVVIDDVAQTVDISINGGTPTSFTGLTGMTAFPTGQVAALLATSSGGLATTGTFERVALWINDAESSKTAIPGTSGWFDASGDAATVTTAWSAWLTGTLS